MFLFFKKYLPTFAHISPLQYFMDTREEGKINSHVAGIPFSEAASCAIVIVASCLQCQTLSVRNVLSFVSILGQRDYICMLSHFGINL